MLALNCRSLVVAAGLLCAGCASDLTVSRPGADAKSRVGIPHPMSMSQYDMSVNFQVKECANPLKLTVTVEVKGPKAVPDRDNVFLLDPTSLSGLLKTAAVEVTYHSSGAVASVNAKVEDRTADVLGALGGLAVSVASFKAVPSQTFTNMAVIPADPNCTDDVIKALEKVTGQTDTVKSTALALDQAVAALKRVTDKIAAMAGQPDEATKRALSQALNSVTAQRKANEAAIKALGATLEAISHTRELVWPHKANDREQQLKLDDSVLATWLKRKVNDGDRAQGVVHLSLAPVLPLPAGSDRIEDGFGIPIRSAAPALLSICSGAPCGTTGSTPALQQRTDNILQAGRVTYLPCTSRVFSSIECSYALDDQGRLTSMGSKNLRSVAETGLGALKGLVDSATERRKIRSEAELKQLEAQTALLKARAAYAAAEAALQPASDGGVAKDTAAAKARADLYNAQRAELEAQAALAAAQAAAAGTP